MRHKIEFTKLPDVNELHQLFRDHQKNYSEERLKEKAREDGKLGIPRNDVIEPTPYEKELLHSTARLASLVASRYKGPLELIDARIKAEREFVDRRYKNELDKIEDIYKAEKEWAEDAYGLKDAHKQLEYSENHYNRLYEKYGRGPIEYVPHWLYVILAMLIFLGEIPLNSLVFQIFGENQVMTWIMAFIIGLSVPVTAHFIGIKAREHPDGFSYSNFMKAVTATAAITTALYALSVMRVQYLGENREPLGLTEALVNSSFGFFWLNLAVLGAAIMIAYLSHDPVPGFQRAGHEVRRARKIVEKREARRIERLKKAAILRSKLLDKANTEHRDGVNFVNLLKGNYDQLLKEGQETESRCLDRLMQQISIYRHENLRHREDRTMPPSFNIELQFEMELRKMNEKIDNDESEIKSA